MALSGIECPQMHWDGDNLKENWRRFKQHMEVMFSGLLKSILDPNVPAVVHPPRRMPMSLKDDIKRELDEMVNSDIIAKIKEGEPTQ